MLQQLVELLLYLLVELLLLAEAVVQVLLHDLDHLLVLQVEGPVVLDGLLVLAQLLLQLLYVFLQLLDSLVEALLEVVDLLLQPLDVLLV